MVINTYNAILKIDPDNRRASDELAGKYRALGRWNDLIAMLTRKTRGAPSSPTPSASRCCARSPICGPSGSATSRTRSSRSSGSSSCRPATPTRSRGSRRSTRKRRQWRALIDVLGREASVLPAPSAARKQAEMARLAAERLGDTRLAIEIYNTVLAEAGGDDVADTLRGARRAVRAREALPRARRDPASPARRAPSGKEAIALLEKLGQIYADRLAAPQQAAAAWQDDPRDRAGPRQGAAHAARALRDRRRLRRARAAVRAARPGGRAGRRAARHRRSPRGQGGAAAARRARRAARAAARRRRRRTRRPRRRRSSARARSGSACSPSIRSTSARRPRSRRSTRSRRSGRG